MDDDAASPPAPGRRGEPAAITVYPGGPMLVRGDVELLDAQGAPIPRRRRVIALCRCGHSGITPFCDGTHKLAQHPRGIHQPENQ